MKRHIIIHNDRHHYKVVDVDGNNHLIPFWGDNGYHQWLLNYKPTDDEVKLGFMQRDEVCFKKFLNAVHGISH